MRDGVAEYLKRIAPFAKIECTEIAEEKLPDNFSPAEKEKTLAREGERLLARVPEGSELIALDVVGEQLFSEELAARSRFCAVKIPLVGRVDSAGEQGLQFRYKD